MARTSITCDDLGDLDNGTARPIMNAALKEAFKDLVDRAEEDGKPRKILIEVELTIKDGIVVAHVQAQAKTPPRRTKGTVCGVRYVNGEPDLFFQSMASNNPEQRTIDEFVPEPENEVE